MDVIDEHGCIIALIQSNEPSETIPDSDASCTRLEVLPGSCMRMVGVGPIDDTGLPSATDATMVFHLDPKLPWIPEWLHRVVTWTMAPWVHAEIERQLSAIRIDPDNPSVI